MANRYSKALKHLKTSHRLSEAPVNSTSGVYALNEPGTKLSKPPADGRIFLPDIDGNYPPGIPGTPGEPFYKRGDGHWSGEVDWDTVTVPSFDNAHLGANGTDTSTLIDDATGTVLTALPPNSRHFILGPLVDGFVYNHGSDAYTTIGYIQKDTRQFVLLGRVNGQWKENLSTFQTYGWGIAPEWDGQESSFTAYNSNFTHEMALWYQKEIHKLPFYVSLLQNHALTQCYQHLAACLRCVHTASGLHKRPVHNTSASFLTSFPSLMCTHLLNY